MKPCYRVCYWVPSQRRWVAHVTRTTRPEAVADRLQAQGFKTLIELRPGKGKPMPMPAVCPDPRLYRGGGA